MGAVDAQAVGREVGFPNFGKPEAEATVRRLIELIGDDPAREGLLETPARVVRSWGELFSGYADGPQDYAKVFTADYDQIVTVRGIDYFSMCEHHMLPFFGKVSIGYLPNGNRKVLGVSKLARIVNVYARRLQIQEQMTQQIAQAIGDAVEPKGVAVVVDGVHLCMMARGVRQHEASMRTSCMLGSFREKPESRAEVLALLGVGR
jgi:GTP cyclohydrolase I